MMRKGGGRGETQSIGNKATLYTDRWKWQRIHVFCIISCLLASSIKLFMHVVQSPEYNAKQESSLFILPNVTRDGMGGDDDSYTLVVVRCRGNMTWATDV
jgi:hypothetical protein